MDPLDFINNKALLAGLYSAYDMTMSDKLSFARTHATLFAQQSVALHHYMQSQDQMCMAMALYKHHQHYEVDPVDYTFIHTESNGYLSEFTNTITFRRHNHPVKNPSTLKETAIMFKNFYNSAPALAARTTSSTWWPVLHALHVNHRGENYLNYYPIHKWSESAILRGFDMAFQRIVARLLVLLSGDVEQNPGPYTAMSVDRFDTQDPFIGMQVDVVHKEPKLSPFDFDYELKYLNKTAASKNAATASGVTHYWSAIKVLNYQLSKLPRINTFIKYTSYNSNSMAPIRIDNNRTIEAKCDVIVKKKREPVTIHITPLHEAIKLLNSSCSGVWNVPITKIISGKPIDNMREIYTRNDGKQLNVNLYFFDKITTKYYVGYVNIDDFPLIFVDYASHCATSLFNHALERSRLVGNTKNIQDEVYHQLYNNKLIAAELNCTNLNTINIHILAIESDINTSYFVKRNVQSYSQYARLVKAPLCSKRFKVWRQECGIDFGLEWRYSQIRQNEYGLGAPISYGSFKNDDVYTTICKYFSFSNSDPVVLPCNDEDFHNLSRLLFDFLLGSRTFMAGIAPEYSDYGDIHLLRAAHTYGISERSVEHELPFFYICNACYTDFDCSDINTHCFNKSNKSLNTFFRSFHKLEAIFNYWMQKILKRKTPDFNALLQYANREHNYYQNEVHLLFKRHAKRRPNVLTMFNGSSTPILIRAAGLNNIYSDTTNIVNKVNSQLDDTKVMIDQIKDKDLINRAHNMLERVDKFLPTSENHSSFTDYLELMDGYLVDQLYKLVTMLNPCIDRNDLPKVRFTMILRDYILAKNLTNPVIKSIVIMDMLKQAGLFEPIIKFYHGYNTSVDSKNILTAGGDDEGGFMPWLLSLLETPMEWFKNIQGILVGFVAVLTDKYNPKHLLDWASKIAPSFRNITSINIGLSSISSLIRIMSKLYYCAKEYVYNLLGIRCNIPLYVGIEKRANHWVSACDTMCMANHRNTIMITPEAWPVVDDIADVGLALLKECKGLPIANLVTHHIKEVSKLRGQISWKRGINSAVFAPFVIHLNGPPNLGKSGLLKNVINFLGTVLQLPTNFYTYNELNKWFDGYNQEHFIVVDDVNLSKDPDNCAWLIKLVSTNVCMLPVAENENRPCVSNCKVLIMTSNTAYSQVEGVATTTGLDRRSTYKFEVSSDDYDKDAVRMKDQNIDWSTTHKFTRIPSVYGADVDKFEGNLSELNAFLATKLCEHYNAEKARIEKNNPAWIPYECTDYLKEKLLSGLVAGSEPIALDVIKEKLNKVNFVSNDSFFHGNRQVTVLTPDQSKMIQNCTVLFRSNGPELYSIMDEAMQIHRTKNCYPCYLTDKIIFKALVPDTYQCINQTAHLFSSFNSQGHSFDPYFLHHLVLTPDGFQIHDYYRRDAFERKLVRPTREATFDYVVLETLLADSSFMDSWKKFFSLTPTARACIYNEFKIHVNTYRHLVLSRERWSVRIRQAIASAWSKQNLEKVLLTTLISLFSVATVGMIVETATSVLVHNYVESKLTSNAPKPPTGKDGVQKIFTSGVKDTSFDNARDKALPNLYLGRILDNRGKILGNFNIVFIMERFALIPYHVFKDKVLETLPNDNSLYVIHIWSDMHGSFLKYTFSKKHTARIPGKDAVLVHINAFRAQRTLIHLWSKEILGEESYGSDVQVFHHDSRALNCSHSKLTCTVPTVHCGQLQNPFVFNDQYSLSDPLPVGSSGGLCMIDSTKHPRKIIGIQSSTQPDSASVQALCRGEITDAINVITTAIGVKVQLPCCDVPFEDAYDPEFPTLIGTVSKENAVTVSPKTTLKKTPWYGEVVPPPDRFPVFRNIPPSEIYNYVNKNEKTFLKPFNPVVLNDTVNEYAEYLRHHIHKHYKLKRPIGSLSLDDAINGNYIGGKPFDLTTSPGVGTGNWIKTRDKPGQHDFITYDGTKYHATQKLKNAITHTYSQALDGCIESSTYASFPKDELRPLLKDARGIDGSPIEQKVLYRMLFGRLDGLLSNMNTGQLRYGLGLNLFSTSGTNLISRITDHSFAWDFSKYDGSITYQMYAAVTKLYNILAQNDELSGAREALSYATCHATIIANDKVYQPNKGMRSGFGGTSSFNTHIHNLFIILAAKQLLCSKINNTPTLYDVFEILDWITYGDDCIAWLKDPGYSEILNGETLSAVFESYGLQVTDPRGKNSSPPKFIPILELTFLKQSPYFDSNFNVPLWRCQEDCIQSVFSYYSGDDTCESLDSAFHMLWPYGQERYEKSREIVNNHLRRIGKVYSKSWQCLYEGFSGDFDSITFTLKSSELTRHCQELIELSGPEHLFE